MNDQAAPTLLSEGTWRHRIHREIGFWKRQLRAASRAAIGMPSSPSPLLVLTTSRSGSTWFCELLFGINQSGLLPEHLRPHHFEYAINATHGRELFQNYLEQVSVLIRSGRDGGSKLIWDYFPEIFSMGDTENPNHILAPLLELEPVCLRLRRSDRVAQAVSRYRSKQTGIYHKKKFAGYYPYPKVLETKSLGEGAFDAVAIAHHYDVLERAEIHLDGVIERLDATVHEVVYEELIEDPSGVLLPIAAALRQDQRPELQQQRMQRALDRATIVKGEDPLQVEWVKRFREERGL